MTNINVSISNLQKKIGMKLSLPDLEYQISMMGVGVESVEGDTLTLEITPNRPDLLSSAGFSRAFLNFLGKGKVLLNYKMQKGDYIVKVDSALKNIRPYTSCAIIGNIDLSDDNLTDIINLQEKLHGTLCRNRKKGAIGVYPLDAIEFPVFFKAMDKEDIKFLALDEKEELKADRILTDTAAGKAYGHLLEGLSKYPVFIDSKGEVLSMPPIINSEKTGKVTTKTKNLFIEVSGFDLDFTSFVLNIITSSVLEIGGELYSVTVDYKTKKYEFPNFTPIKNKLDIKYAFKLLGLELKENEIKKALNKMGHEFRAGVMYSPPWRGDLLSQIDLVEEIAIGYGYNNFKEQNPNISTVGGEDEFISFLGKVSNLLIGQNYFEVNTLELTNLDNLTKKMKVKQEPISLKNSISESYNKLRNQMLPSLIEVFTSNIHNEYPQRIYEMGHVFTADGEKTKLCVAILDAKVSFTTIKQVSQEIFSSFDLKERYAESDSPSFIEGRCASVYVGKKEIGVLGEVSPYVLEEWGLSYPVCALEFDLDELFSLF